MRCLLPLLALTACTGDETADPLVDYRGTDAVWGEVYDGSDPTVPFLPDQNARYWRYAFDRPADGWLVRVRTTLYGTRYQAFDLYDDEARTSVGAVRETALVDEPWFDISTNSTWLAIPEGVQRLALFLRIYDPEGRAPDPALPDVDLFERSTGESLEPPARIEPPELPQALIDVFLEQLEIPQRDDRVDFYRLPAEGLYAAFDNQYLAAQIVRDPDQVLLLTLDPPDFSAAWDDPADIRYWSLTQCDRHSFCHHTLADHQVPTGPIEIVIGDEDPALRDAAGTRIFVPWSTPDDEMVLIYRNLATAAGYADALSTVPLFDFDQPPEGQEATATVGDRAPTGVRCDRDAFLDGSCTL